MGVKLSLDFPKIEKAMENTGHLIMVPLIVLLYKILLDSDFHSRFISNYSRNQERRNCGNHFDDDIVMESREFL
jgi:hypothetical protein